MKFSQLNFATKLTLSRVLAVPVMVLLLHFFTPGTYLAAAVLFILASITDFFDGIVARRYGQVTNLGKFLDPLADKVLVCSAFIMMSAGGVIPAWIVVVMVSREIIITGLRAVAAEQQVVLAADRYGKMKTFFQTFAIPFLLLQYTWPNIFLGEIGMGLLIVALALAIISGVNYLYIFYKTCI